ncbi:MAG: helix-turn-helix transcriptional regulator [Acidimicrobiia bacterium]|nr:helix-turn-helix transcriptional regulator [Acidimicrobiia bacterium]
MVLTRSPTHLPAELVTLADELGIVTRYLDGTGTARSASPDTVLTLARALGVPLDRPDEAGAAREHAASRASGAARSPRRRVGRTLSVSHRADGPACG